jgi:hypothetical protein
MRRKPSNRTPAVFSPSFFTPPKIFTKEQSQYLVRFEFDQILCTYCAVVSKTSISIQCDPTPVFRQIYTQRMINFVHSFKINTNFSADEVGKNYCLTFWWIQCIYTIKIFKSGIHVHNVSCPLYYWLLKFVCVVYYILGNCQLHCSTFFNLPWRPCTWHCMGSLFCYCWYKCIWCSEGLEV